MQYSTLQPEVPRTHHTSAFPSFQSVRQWSAKKQIKFSSLPANNRQPSESKRVVINCLQVLSKELPPNMSHAQVVRRHTERHQDAKLRTPLPHATTYTPPDILTANQHAAAVCLCLWGHPQLLIMSAISAAAAATVVIAGCITQPPHLPSTKWCGQTRCFADAEHRVRLAVQTTVSGSKEPEHVHFSDESARAGCSIQSEP